MMIALHSERLVAVRGRCTKLAEFQILCIYYSRNHNLLDYTVYLKSKIPNKDHDLNLNDLLPTIDSLLSLFPTEIHQEQNDR